MPLFLYIQERRKNDENKTSSIDIGSINLNDGGVTTECYGKKQGCTK